MPGSQKPHWRNPLTSYIYTVERSGPGALSREPAAHERLGELNKGDVMKALVVAVLNSLSSASAANARDGRQRGNLR